MFLANIPQRPLLNVLRAQQGKSVQNLHFHQSHALLVLTAMVLSVFHAILAIIVLLLQMVLNLVLMALTPMKQEQLAAEHVMLDIPA